MKHPIWTALILISLVGCNGNQSEKTAKEADLTGIEIPTISALKLGIDTLRLNDLSSKIKSQEYPNIHSVLIAKNGALFYEKYFQGQDQIFGRDIGNIQFTDSTLHDIRSVTKSIISSCVGIAIDKGYLESVDQKVADFFPELDTLFREEKSNWTIQNFLTMTTGLDWNEDVPYDNPENDEIQMTSSQDPVKYVLSQPLRNIPGEQFNYSGGATQVLAEIIVRASKIPIDQFVKENLFAPLEIENFEWTKYSDWEGADEFAVASGLRLTARDLMKIGMLYRNKGQWNGRQIISSEWVQESFVQRVEFPSAVAAGNDAYGYQFWMWPVQILGNEFKMIAAIGNGGQNIYWDLKNDIIVVTTAGNYNNWGIKNDPYALLRNEIYPLVLN